MGGNCSCGQAVPGRRKLSGKSVRGADQTLVMTGDEDYGNSPEMTRAIAAEIPGARTVILEGLRHLAMIEDPARFNTALLSFLNAVRDGRAS